MFDCQCLIHPFQNDPGTSQRQRVMDELLSGAAQIDARTLADLLDYFVQLSRHINYYDARLNVSDWQSFFKNSLPFTLASLIRSQPAELAQNLSYYHSLFEKKHSSAGLQLQAYFIFYHFIHKINNWHLALKGSGLPVEITLEVIIRDKLQQPLRSFISYTNAAVKWYGIRRIDFSRIIENRAWNIDLTDLYAIDHSFNAGTGDPHRQLSQLYEKFKLVSSPFLDSLAIISSSAHSSLEQSLLPLKAELQKTHPPHLGLLFAFLNIFRYLQNDLNGYTRKHLDFFYKDVLQIKTREAIPDKAHLIFDIQKQLKKYLVQKGVLVKNGKDNNKQEILFSLDDEIVVNKTEIVALRTLFVNNRQAFAQSYVEGLYMAPDATRADGVDKDFDDGQSKNFPTLGAKLSKYFDPETKVNQPYPAARLGFILGSPVLYLREGTRTVNITIACQVTEAICREIGSQLSNASKNCCHETGAGSGVPANPYPVFLSAEEIYGAVQSNIQKKYVYLEEPLFKLALATGFDEELVERVRERFLLAVTTLQPCYCDVRTYQSTAAILWDDWDLFITPIVPDAPRRQILDEIFRPLPVLNVLFSGEKNWVEPGEVSIAMSNLAGDKFMLSIEATIGPEMPAVSFYDKEKLKEDFNTIQPLVKIELNDRLKLDWTITPRPAGDGDGPDCCEQDQRCCLLKKDEAGSQAISFYHFFRNVTMIKKIGNDDTDISDETRINVQVCGLKNLIVQNDESLQDVNGPVYPFGVRPRVESNFYIGSEEIFMKNWTDIIVNLNWKDLPPVPTTGDFIGRPFEAYYNGYQDFFIQAGVQDKVVEDNKFKVQIAVLQDGNWIYRTPLTDCNAFTDPEWRLFQENAAVPGLGCADNANYSHQFALNNISDFPGPSFPLPLEPIHYQGIKRFDVNSRNSFIRLTLKCQDFQHDRYPFILARQMSALGKLPDIVDGAVYYGVTIPGPPPVFTTLNMPVILQEIIDNYNLSLGPAPFDLKENSRDLVREIIDRVRFSGQVNAAVWNNLFLVDNPSTFIFGDPTPFPPPPLPVGLNESDSFYFDRLAKILDWLKGLKEKVEKLQDKGVVIPNAPWTPVISSMAVDYKATAAIDNIDLVHLYPFSGTHKQEVAVLQPTLFPTYCDEGTLFLGLREMVPGDHLQVLFQLAEATSDSESAKQDVNWHYLDNNSWKPLRKGFEVLQDNSENLTTSGVIKFALPANMTNSNTVMPPGLHWIKASIAQNSGAVSETTGIYPQAQRVTFTNAAANDKLRLSQPLAAGSISKLLVADANVKSIRQPYDSFGGIVPEAEQQFYVRVSELLRHKGRAIQKFDYERLALEAFPQLFKVKCINHSFALDAHLYKNDFPYAPGYLILAVIPDLFKLQAGNSFEPKVPISLIEKIEAYLRKRTSPFVRLRAMNPRYEKVNFCLRVKLLPGKDENYYQEKLKQDLKELLAPWAVGKYDKLSFGQCVYRSDIIRFLESTDYVDFITDLRMAPSTGSPVAGISKICPETPRSILIAGNIEVCVDQPGCNDWKACYGPNQERIDCCTSPVIPVVDYCTKSIETPE